MKTCSWSPSEKKFQGKHISVKVDFHCSAFLEANDIVSNHRLGKAFQYQLVERFGLD